jgi:pilus assembly protein CpaB
MKRSVLIIGLAVVLAAVGALSVLYYVRQADARALAGKEAVRVLVAAARVPAGTSAAAAQAAGLLRAEPMPAESVPAEALGKVGPEIAELVAGADIQPGQLILRSLFVAEVPKSTGLPIPDGKVAVTVALGVTQQVAGFVRAGSMVAVFDTRGGGTTQSGPREGVATTRVLLPEVEVIAVGPAPAGGQVTQSTSNGAAPATGQVMLTFAVDTVQAERLILGSQTGSLHLALLTEQTGVKAGTRTDTTSLFGSTRKGG